VRCQIGYDGLIDGSKGVFKMQKTNKKIQKGLTLLELIVTMVVASILAAMVIPNFTASVDKSKASAAAVYLRVIRTGERVYYTTHNTYIACAATPCTITDIKDKLGVEVTTESYNFSIGPGLTGDIATSFYATATSLKDASTIRIDQDGTFTGTSNYLPSS